MRTWVGSAVCVSLALGGSATLYAQVRFPHNPHSVSECENAYEQAKALARQYHAKGVQISDQSAAIGRQRQASCSGGRDYTRCSAPYDQRIRELHPHIMQAFAERDRINREAHGPYMQCRQMARAYEQQQEAQKQAMAEQQQRQRQTNAEAERRNAHLQAENDRRVREMQYEQQRAQQQRDAYTRQQQQQQYAQQQHNNQLRQEYQARQMAEVQRSLGALSQAAQQRQEERQQQRTIATYDNPYAGRNEPRVVQTPEMRQAAEAQARADAANAQRLEALQTGQALRQIYDQAKDGRDTLTNPQEQANIAQRNVNRLTDAGRRGAYDRSLNPNGYRDPGVDGAVTSAKEINSTVNRARGMPDVATRTANDAYAATGSVANNALGSFDQAMNNFNNSGSGSSRSSGSGSSSSSSGSSSGPMPRVNAPISSLDGLQQAVVTPEGACKSAAVGAARERCIADQCKLPQFQNHLQCRKTP